MEKGLKLEILYLDNIESTQTYLIENIKNITLKAPICVYSDNQTKGIGSRGNSWIGEKGNLFFSFCIDKSYLNHIPIQSISIYFGFLFKEVLSEFGSKVLLKWPNDLYLENKIGGIITNIVSNNIICGIGVNTTSHVNNFDRLDLEIDNLVILNSFFKKIEKRVSWNEVFNKFKVEFYNTNFVTSNGIYLKDSILNSDGSISINNERKYSFR
jgi:BirA family biotin operon repressor/biotin-[acetyl-CoA-carboxylase] ligase